MRGSPRRCRPRSDQIVRKDSGDLDEEHRVGRLGFRAAADAAPIASINATIPSIRPVDLFFSGLRLPCASGSMTTDAAFQVRSSQDFTLNWSAPLRPDKIRPLV